MEVISIQKIQDRPIIDAIATDDFFLIGDVSDGSQVKRVTVATLRAFILAGSTLPPNPSPDPTFATRYLGINCGGDQYIDSEGDMWIADQYFSGASGQPGQFSSGEILGTTEDTLFYTDRYGEFTYTIPTLDNSPHQISFYFSEPYWQHLTDRIFRIRINDTLVANNIDIFSEVGYKTAAIKTFVATPVNQQIQVVFQSINDNALVNAILVKR